jgi:hypothetical protein
MLEERAGACRLTDAPGPPGDQLERRALCNGVQVPFGLAVHASRALVRAAADLRRETVTIAARSRDSIAQRRAALLTGIRIQKIDRCCCGGGTYGGQPDCCSDFRSRSLAATQEKQASTGCEHLALLDGLTKVHRIKARAHQLFPLSEHARGACEELLRTQQLGNGNAAQSAFAQAAKNLRERRSSKLSMIGVTFVTVMHEHDVPRCHAG